MNWIPQSLDTFEAVGYLKVNKFYPSTLKMIQRLFENV